MQILSVCGKCLILRSRSSAVSLPRALLLKCDPRLTLALPGLCLPGTEQDGAESFPGPQTRGRQLASAELEAS